MWPGDTLHVALLGEHLIEFTARVAIAIEHVDFSYFVRASSILFLTASEISFGA